MYFCSAIAVSEMVVSIIKAQQLKGLYNEILRQGTRNSISERDSGHG